MRIIAGVVSTTAGPSGNPHDVLEHLADPFCFPAETRTAGFGSKDQSGRDWSRGGGWGRCPVVESLGKKMKMNETWSVFAGVCVCVGDGGGGMWGGGGGQGCECGWYSCCLRSAFERERFVFVFSLGPLSLSVLVQGTAALFLLPRSSTVLPYKWSVQSMVRVKAEVYYRSPPVRVFCCPTAVLTALAH